MVAKKKVVKSKAPAKKAVKKNSKKRSIKTVAKDKLKATEKMAHAELKKAKAKFVEHEKKVREFAQKNPEKALAIAAGIGAALGAIVVTAVRKKRK